jgi:hypothetical protein
MTLQEPKREIKRAPRSKVNFNPYHTHSLIKLELATQLAIRGARPANISAITSIPQSVSTRLYQESIQKKAPHGIIPTCTSKNMRSPTFRIEASVFMGIFKHFMQDGLSLGQAVINSYDIYSKFFKDKNKLCINRCYNLIKLVEADLAKFVVCNKCFAQYVVLSDQQLLNGRQCPLCNLVHVYHLNLNKQTNTVT